MIPLFFSLFGFVPWESDLFANIWPTRNYMVSLQSFIKNYEVDSMKYALVTGGSRGLGRAVCVKLASLKIPVIINYQNNVAAANETLQEIEEGGGVAELLQFDVADANAAQNALQEWEQKHPEDYIAYLINNAGIRRDGMMFMMPDEDWHDVLRVTLDGFYNVTKPLLPKMMQRRHGGRIVNMASLSGVKGMEGQTNYSAAKAALIGATKALALEVASRSVTVNAVAPGFIETDMTKDLPQDELKQLVPVKRFGRPEEVAALVAFLCSDEAAYITGETININGGLYT